MNEDMLADCGDCVSRDNAVFQLRLELKARQELIEQRISRAEVNSRPWHQLEGQSIEIDHMIVRLMDL